MRFALIKRNEEAPLSSAVRGATFAQSVIVLTPFLLVANLSGSQKRETEEYRAEDIARDEVA